MGKQIIRTFRDEDLERRIVRVSVDLYPPEAYEDNSVKPVRSNDLECVFGSEFKDYDKLQDILCDRLADAILSTADEIRTMTIRERK